MFLSFIVTVLLENPYSKYASALALNFIFVIEV